MKLSDYLIQLSRDDTKAPEDRVLYLYDTVNNTYYTKVIHPSSYDRAYIFFTFDEPFHDALPVQSETVRDLLHEVRIEGRRHHSAEIAHAAFNLHLTHSFSPSEKPCRRRGRAAL